MEKKDEIYDEDEGYDDFDLDKYYNGNIYNEEDSSEEKIDTELFDDSESPETKMKMYDFSKVNVFQKFLNENYDKCFMDDIDYSINEKVLDKWQDCLKSRYITNLEDTKRMVETKFLAKDNIEDLANITEQDGKNILDFSNVVRSNLIRITFNELLERTNKISNELIHLLRGQYKNHKIVIVIDNHLYSSNTWYTMLIMKPLFDIIDIKNRIVNVIDKVSQFQDNEMLSPFDPINNQQSQVLNENEKIKSSFLRYKNTFFIHADDMSYSGQQLLCNIPTGLKYLFKDRSGCKIKKYNIC